MNLDKGFFFNQPDKSELMINIDEGLKLIKNTTESTENQQTKGKRISIQKGIRTLFEMF